MPSERPTPNATALKGWRARAWAWVLFAALVKGLIPHAALASALMTGNPALVWCAPGKASGGAEAIGSGAMSAADHSCVCASSGDGALPVGQTVAPYAQLAPPQAQPTLLAVAASPRLLPPPARGPPVV